MIRIYCQNIDFIPFLGVQLGLSGYDASCQLCAGTDWDGQVTAVWVGAEAPADLDRANVFDAGFRLGALFDRIGALLLAAEGSAVLKHGPFMLDMSGMALIIVEQNLILTDTEKRLMAALIKAGGAPLSREALMQQVWAYSVELETHTVETHIYRLRQKLGQAGDYAALLKTADEGYFLDV